MRGGFKEGIRHQSLVHGRKEILPASAFRLPTSGWELRGDSGSTVRPDLIEGSRPASEPGPVALQLVILTGSWKDERINT